jgi:hypothetical protein
MNPEQANDLVKAQLADVDRARKNTDTGKYGPTHLELVDEYLSIAMAELVKAKQEDELSEYEFASMSGTLEKFTNLVIIRDERNKR